MIDKYNTPKNILDGSGLIAKNTAAVCNWCKAAGQEPKLKPEDQKQFVQFAKEISTKTAQLVTSIKQLAINRSDESRRKCEEASSILNDTIDRLILSSNQPSYIGRPAILSAYGTLLQRPIIDNCQASISKAVDMIGMAQSLCSNIENDSLKQTFIDQVKQLGDLFIDAATSVRQAAPAQKECDKVVKQITETINQLEQTSPTVFSPSIGNDEKSLSDSLQVISNLSEVITKATRADVVQLVSTIEELPANFIKANYIQINNFYIMLYRLYNLSSVFL